MHSSGARCAKADRLTHDEPEIEPTGMNQEAFQNVRVTAQMGTAHAPGVIEMGERVLDHLAASRHRAAVPRSADGFAYNCCDPQVFNPTWNSSRLAQLRVTEHPTAPWTVQHVRAIVPSNR